MELTQEQVNSIVKEARTAAQKAAQNFFQEILGGHDQFPCGFAWTNIYGVKASTKLGKMLAQAGIKKNDYERAFQIWNPGSLMIQNVDAILAGAEAAAAVFRKYGFDARAGSRWD